MSEHFAIGVAVVSAAGALAALALVDGLRGDSVPLLVVGSILGAATVLGLAALGRIVVVTERTRGRR